MTLQYTKLAGALLAVALATTANAHASLETQEAAVDGRYKAVMRITHGCEGQATHTVIITIPEGFYNAKPMPKAGWRLETVRGDYETPYSAHGRDYLEGVQQIIWSGGELQDDWYDEFTFRGSFGPYAETGLFHFPTTQLCADGELNWTNVTNDPDAGNPAPKLMLVAAELDHTGHSMEMSVDTIDHATTEFGNLTLTDIFAYATLPNAPVAGGFLMIENLGNVDDRLIAASSDVAGETQIHEMAIDGDIMRMRELDNGLVIPAGETVVVEPGGYHLMFMKLQQPLVVGEHFDVTLTFENAGTITVSVDVRSKRAGHGN